MSDTLQLTGTIKKVLPLKNIALKSGENMQIASVVITTDDKYPQDIPMEAVNDKASLLTSLNVGQRVTAAFNLRSYEYKGEVRMSAPRVWKVDADTAPTPSQPAAPSFQNVGGGTTSDLPF